MATSRQANEFPLTYGRRRPEELALLLQEGLTYKEIAERWGMRRLAGARDLRIDAEVVWERAGSPGAPMPPDVDSGEGYHPLWERYRVERQSAIRAWLSSLLEGGLPVHHCVTCTCRIPIEEASSG